MVRIINYKLSENNDGKEFATLETLPGISLPINASAARKSKVDGIKQVFAVK